MKKIQLLSIMILSGAIAFGAKETAPKAQVNFQESLARVESSGSIADLVINADKAIHGLQFDITYNPSEIKSITPQPISGFEVKYNELSDGLIRGLVFSLQGLALPEKLPFEFINVKGFDGNSSIQFKDVILADEQGLGLDVQAAPHDHSFSDNMLPIRTGLSDAYPNPFNPTTKIEYGLQKDGYVEIMIYDAAGRLVEELVNQNQIRGNHEITWNASTQASYHFCEVHTAGLSRSIPCNFMITSYLILIHQFFNETTSCIINHNFNESIILQSIIN
jgi:hypothetical protein